MGLAQLPDGASLRRVDAVTRQVDQIALSDPSTTDIVALDGFGILDGLNRSNQATYFITLKDWGERTAPDQSAFALLKKFGSD
jgi:multidrug efflux pump subunit AcrB